jgi:hypothetical protein
LITQKFCDARCAAECRFLLADDRRAQGKRLNGRLRHSYRRTKEVRGLRVKARPRYVTAASELYTVAVKKQSVILLKECITFSVF